MVVSPCINYLTKEVKDEDVSEFYIPFVALVIGPFACLDLFYSAAVNNVDQIR